MDKYSFYEFARNKVAFELMQAKAEAMQNKAEAEADGLSQWGCATC